MTLGEADLWRIVSAVFAAICLILALTLRGSLARAHVAEARTAHAIFDCYTAPGDRDHQGFER